MTVQGAPGREGEGMLPSPAALALQKGAKSPCPSEAERKQHFWEMEFKTMPLHLDGSKLYLCTREKRTINFSL